MIHWLVFWAENWSNKTKQPQNLKQTLMHIWATFLWCVGLCVMKNNLSWMEIACEKTVEFVSYLY